MTKKDHKAIIKRYKDQTGYFDESVPLSRMYDMLRRDMRFGEAETKVIISALILAGAKFKT